MPECKRKKGKHLTLEDRHEIQRGLREHRTFVEIARIIGCTPETISKEIRNHRYCKKHDYKRYVPNTCKYRFTCRRRNVCNKKKPSICRIPCRECTSCNKRCPDYVYAPCNVANHAPYACNACHRTKNCLFDKYLYNADYAHKEYLEKLHQSRMGIDMTRDELVELDQLVSPLILKGQPIAHIMQSHGDEISCSIRTLYTYIGKGYLTAKNLDMRRVVRYRKRKHNGEPVAVSERKAGRQYEDFQKLLEQNPDQRVVEMDTVEGTKGGKLLHTFLWRENNLMLAYLIENKEMRNTVSVLDQMEADLGEETFRELFPVILTDNGSEFADPLLFENGKNGEKRTSLFFCEPRMSNQKGSLEKNHEYIRYVLPKGTSFDELTQADVRKIINHINSTARPKLRGMTPVELALQTFGASALEKLSLSIIPSDEVCLKPELLR